MMLEHIAIWTSHLEEMREFYVKYFNAVPNEKYVSLKEFSSKFESYFLSFDSGARLELMQMSSIPDSCRVPGSEFSGLTHIAFSVETKEELEAITERIRADGFQVIGEPRMTGDGYYESCVLDPDGTRVEITVVP